MYSGGNGGAGMEKAEILAAYPLARDTLRALDKLRVTCREVIERLVALARRAGRVAMGWRRCGVLEIEAAEVDDGPGSSATTHQRRGCWQWCRSCVQSECCRCGPSVGYLLQ